MTSGRPHVPVLLDRVVELLVGAPDGVLVDGTLGAGGHARAVLDARRQAGRSTVLLGIDRDPAALELAAEHLADTPEQRHLVQARFDELPRLLDDLGLGRPVGVLLDLGISSMHVDDPARGFSYRDEGPLDMRMDPTSGPSAADLVNGADQRELARIISRYGGERFAGRIADAIVARRPLHTTVELAEVVRDAIPAPARRHGGHPATRTFQALRIAVNGELEALEQLLPVALERLTPGGVAVVISYHSLEDRIVKRAFGAASRGCICPPDLPVCACGRTPLVELVTSRPERPDDVEIATNRRARSALLRAVRRRPDPTPTEDTNP